MAVSRDDVVQGFELILGRTPDGPAIEYHVALPFADLRAFIDYLIKTGEFRTRYDGFVDEGLAPPPAAVVREAEAPKQARPLTVFLGDRVLATKHDGRRLYLVPTDVDAAPAIMTEGIWEPHVEQAVAGQLRPGQVAADVGAGTGYHTLAMAAAVGKGGRVHAFEPHPELARLLEPTVLANGFGKMVTVHARAVMDQPGWVTLAGRPNRLGSGNVVPPDADEDYHAAHAEQHTVESVTLDAVFADQPAPDLIRLDIAGAEPQALLGAQALIGRSPELRIVARWAANMIQRRANLDGFLRWLDGFGLRFWIISPSGTLFQPVERVAQLRAPSTDVLIARKDPA